MSKGMLGPPETAAFLLFLLFLFSRADLIRMLRQGRRRALEIIWNTPHETIRIFPNTRRVIGRAHIFFRTKPLEPRLNFKDQITGDLEDLAFNLREKGDDQLEEIREAWLETNGKLSLVRRTDSKPVQKQDLRLLGCFESMYSR